MATNTQTAVLSDPAYRIHDGWLLLARILVVGMYVFSGLGKAMDVPGTAAMIASKGLPMPSVFAILAAALEIAGALAIIIGWHTRLAAIALLLFTALAAYFFHDFWHAAAAEQLNQMIHFMKNVSIIGAFLMIAAVGGGRYSVDGRVRVRSAL